MYEKNRCFERYSKADGLTFSNVCHRITQPSQCQCRTIVRSEVSSNGCAHSVSIFVFMSFYSRISRVQSVASLWLPSHFSMQHRVSERASDIVFEIKRKERYQFFDVRIECLTIPNRVCDRKIGVLMCCKSKRTHEIYLFFLFFIACPHWNQIEIYCSFCSPHNF